MTFFTGTMLPLLLMFLTIYLAGKPAHKRAQERRQAGQKARIHALYDEIDGRTRALEDHTDQLRHLDLMIKQITEARRQLGDGDPMGPVLARQDKELRQRRREIWGQAATGDLQRVITGWCAPSRCPHSNLASPELCRDCGHDPRYYWTSFTKDNVTSYRRAGCRHLTTEDIRVCDWAPSLNGWLVGRLCTNCDERIEEPE